MDFSVNIKEVRETGSPTGSGRALGFDPVVQDNTPNRFEILCRIIWMRELKECGVFYG
jgi:hypothetical protein